MHPKQVIKHRFWIWASVCTQQPFRLPRNSENSCDKSGPPLQTKNSIHCCTLVTPCLAHGQRDGCHVMYLPPYCAGAMRYISPL